VHVSQGLLVIHCQMAPLLDLVQKQGANHNQMARGMQSGIMS